MCSVDVCYVDFVMVLQVLKLIFVVCGLFGFIELFGFEECVLCCKLDVVKGIYVVVGELVFWFVYDMFYYYFVGEDIFFLNLMGFVYILGVEEVDLLIEWMCDGYCVLVGGVDWFGNIL